MNCALFFFKPATCTLKLITHYILPNFTIYSIILYTNLATGFRFLTSDLYFFHYILDTSYSLRSTLILLNSPLIPCTSTYFFKTCNPQLVIWNLSLITVFYAIWLFLKKLKSFKSTVYIQCIVNNFIVILKLWVTIGL